MGRRQSARAANWLGDKAKYWSSLTGLRLVEDDRIFSDFSRLNLSQPCCLKGCFSSSLEAVGFLWIWSLGQHFRSELVTSAWEQKCHLLSWRHRHAVQPEGEVLGQVTKVEDCLGILQKAVQRVRWLLCSVILQRVSPLCPLTIDRPNRLLKLKSSELLWMLCSLTSCNQVPCLQNWHSDSVLLRSASSWITLHYCLLFSDSPKLFTCIPGHWCKQTVIMGLNQHRSAVSGSSGLPAHTNLFSRCRQSEWSLIAQSRWLNATAAGWLNRTKGNSHVSLHTLYHMKQGD